MARIADLKISITDMDRETALNKVLEIRTSRRTSKRKPTQKAGRTKKEKQVVTQVELASLIAALEDLDVSLSAAEEAELFPDTPSEDEDDTDEAGRD